MAEQATGLAAAADRIREAAKWLTVSLAAIGAVIVAGVQLTDLGNLEVGSDRFRLAIVGGVLVAVGAVVILVATTSVMTGTTVSLQSVASKPPPRGTKEVVADASLLGGHDDVESLKSEYLAALKGLNRAHSEYLKDPDAIKRQAADVAGVRAATVHATARELLNVASYAQLARRWRSATWWIIGGAVLGVAGIGIYAWSANPTADAVASAATPNVLTAPMAKKLTLTAEGIESLKEALGPSCDTRMPINVLLLASTNAGPDVLTDQAPECNRVRFILGPAWGTVDG